MLSGINASRSFFGGAILAWAIIAPALITTGRAFGVPFSLESVVNTYTVFHYDLHTTSYPGNMNYMSMVLEDLVNKPSPRYWLIWPGTMLLICGAFSEIFANYKAIGQ